MDHAVDVAVQTNKQTELGDVADFATDGGADRVGLEESFPWVGHGLLEAQRDPTLGGVDVEDDDFHFLRGRYDLARVHVLLGPGHFGDVDQALDPRHQLNKGTVVGDVGDAAVELGANREFRCHGLPWIGLQLLHAQRDALSFAVELDHLYFDRLTHGQHFGRMVDAAPRNIRDVQQAIDTAEIDERTVVGDVLDHTLQHAAFFEVLDQLLTLLGAGFFQHRTARNDDVAARLVHLQDLERLGVVHQGGNVAHRADVDLRAGQEGHGPAEVDGEATLDAVEDNAFHADAVVELLFQLNPGFFATGLIAGQHDFAVLVLVTLDEDLDGVAGFDGRLLAGHRKFFNRHATFRFEADIDDHQIIFDAQYGTGEDGPFEGVAD